MALAIVLVALPPRLLDTDRFVTTDELFWVGRSAAFSRALGTGQLAQTFQSGHPGVTTMWTAVLGMGTSLAGQLAPSRREVSRREVAQSPAFMPALAAARRAFGVVTALGSGVAVLLAWRLFGAWPATLGGLLLALDPFFLAHARLVHIDASLALWSSLAVLAALARWEGGGRLTLVAAGVATGLALLSKSPALILVPVIPLMLVLVRGPRVLRSRAAWRDLAVWAGVAALTCVAVWPALWAAPSETLGRYVAFVRENSNPDHAAAADGVDAGAWFYPLVFVLRSTPLTWLGLLGLAVSPPRGRTRRIVLALVLFALAFGGAMTVAAKGFDRYLLPIFPALDLLAGLGLWRLARLVGERAGRSGLGEPGRARRLAAPVAAAALVMVVSVGSVVGAWPYLLTYANPLAGGNPAAHRLIASGWGEGLDRAAAYLNARPAGDRSRVGMPGEIYTTVLDAQLDGTVAPAEGYDAGAYDALVVYIRNQELGERPPFFDAELLSWTPAYTVELGGVPYAWVYNTNAGAPVGAELGGVLRLDGYGLDTAQPRAGRRLELRLRWQPRQVLLPGLGLAVELRPEAGGRVRTLMLPLEPAGEATAWAPEVRTSVAYQVTLDPDLAPGSYILAVRVVGADGEPLPVTAQPPRPAGVPSEAAAVPLRRIQIR